MGKIYRVLVIEQDDRDGDRFASTVPQQRTLFEAAGPDPERLLAYAPTEVAAALGEAAGSAVPLSAPLVDRQALEAAVAEKLSTEAATVAEPVTTGAPKARKPRRTKAEIAADEAAKLASQTGADPGPQNQAAVAEAAAEAPQAVDAPASTPLTPPPAASDAPPAAPWNPFQQR